MRAVSAFRPFPSAHLLVAWAVLVLCMPALGAAQAPAPFMALYKVRHKSGAHGVMQLELRRDGDGGAYTYESRTRARGLARLIRGGEVFESTVVEVSAGGIRPNRYLYRDGTRKGKRNAEIVFDWAAGVARSSYKGRDEEVALSAGTLDQLAVQLAVMRDLSRGLDPVAYNLVHHNELKTYRFELLPPEARTTPAGQFETVRLRRTREGLSRVIYLWAAQELGYLPVRVELWKEGKRQTEAELQSFTLTAATDVTAVAD